MTSATEDQIPAAWRRSVRRAITRRIKATLCSDGSFRVPSGSIAGAAYHLHLDEHGKVGPCTCQAAERFGAEYPCAHRGAVARALFALRGITITPPAALAVESTAGRSQIFREAA